jgi:SAM-dependent methyltransferase
VTTHFLEICLPKEGLVLDAGGGPGRYTIDLAKRGYDVVLCRWSINSFVAIRVS